VHVRFAHAPARLSLGHTTPKSIRTHKIILCDDDDDAADALAAHFDEVRRRKMKVVVGSSLSRGARAKKGRRWWWNLRSRAARVDRFHSTDQKRT
jgi:hypothetical protein